MPNWCNNSVTFTHSDPEQIARVVKAYNDERLFDEFLPCPPELREETAVGEDFVKRDEERTTALYEKYGFSSWYDWQVAHWGTKWDVNTYVKLDDLPDAATCVSLGFDTAWSPPIEFYQHMEEQGFHIEAFYYESGMAFCGVYEDGSDDSFEITGDSDWVEKHIPRRIDEAFSISELMSDWESEQELSKDGE
jgi:hypothetical protein